MRYQAFFDRGLPLVLGLTGAGDVEQDGIDPRWLFDNGPGPDAIAELAPPGGCAARAVLAGCKDRAG